MGFDFGEPFCYTCFERSFRNMRTTTDINQISSKPLYNVRIRAARHMASWATMLITAFVGQSIRTHAAGGTDEPLIPNRATSQSGSTNDLRSNDVVTVRVTLPKFGEITNDRFIAADDLFALVFDKYPVSPGHSLIVARRDVATFQDLTSEEKKCLLLWIERIQKHLIATLRPAPDAFNFGLNDGAAAGQTIKQFHFHIIPRYVGDVPDPRGGVRYVIPSKARYWITTNQPAERQLSTNHAPQRSTEADVLKPAKSDSTTLQRTTNSVHQEH